MIHKIKNNSINLSIRDKTRTFLMLTLLEKWKIYRVTNILKLITTDIIQMKINNSNERCREAGKTEIASCRDRVR